MSAARAFHDLAVILRSFDTEAAWWSDVMGDAFESASLYGPGLVRRAARREGVHFRLEDGLVAARSDAWLGLPRLSRDWVFAKIPPFLNEEIDPTTGKPIRCAYCGSTERNLAHTRMACWEDPNGRCRRAMQLMRERYGENFDAWTPEACARAYSDTKAEELEGFAT